MNKTVTAFLVGAVAGAALVTFMQTPVFRKGASKLVSAGMQLKKDASAFVESIKEDAEDVAAEAEYQAAQAASSAN